MSALNRFKSVARAAVALRGNKSGLALTEFALSLPILMIMTASGLELGNFMLVKRRVADIAVQTADNASRIGLDSLIATKQVREVDINDLFMGAQLQSGKFDISKNGRIIISSLEVNSTGGQWLHWQRCYGADPSAPAYGTEGDGSTGNSFKGMGPTGNQIKSIPDNAVMFVEVYYKYTPLVSFTPLDFGTIKEEASFFARDNRDLTQVYNPSPSVTPMTC
jgi:hypothetical protein